MLAQLNGSAGEYQHLHCVVQVLAFALCCCASISICTVLLCKHQHLHCVVQISAVGLCCWQASTFALCCINISSYTVLFASISICTDFVHMHTAFFVCVVVQLLALHYVVNIMLTRVSHMKLLVRGSCLFLSHSYRCRTYEVTGQGIMPFSVALLQVSDI